MRRYHIWLGAGVTLFAALVYHLAWIGTIPPGLDRDAAANGWLALNWLRDELVPFWMPHASAPEPLIVWVQTATIAMLGPSVTALRVASALFMSLAAVVVYLLTLEVAKPFIGAQRGWAAFLAGLVFACNPVITQLARTGLRATTLPLLSGLFFLLLLRAWRTHARRDYLLSGLALGVAAYTYLAARFLPIVIVVFVALAWWMERRKNSNQASFRRVGEEESPLSAGAREGIPHCVRNDVSRIVGLALMAVVAFLVVFPQLIFFAMYPSSFLERAQSVSLFTNPDYAESGLAHLLVDKLVGMALMFGIEWWGQYNQAARPLLAPLPFIGLLLALPLVWRWRRQPAMLLMVVAWLTMLLPDLIGGDRVRPHELRVIGAFVPTIVLSGVGLAYGLGWLVQFVRGKAAWHVTGALVALLIVVWGVVEWFGVAAPILAKSDYAWFAQPDVAVAQAVNVNNAPLLIPLNEYSRSVVAYLTAQRIRQLRSGVDASGATVQPASERVLLVWPADPERARVESISYRFDPQSLVLIDGDRAYLMPPAGADVAVLQRACVVQPFTTATGEMAGATCALDFAAFGFPMQLPTPEAVPEAVPEAAVTWRVDDLYNDTLRLRGISADQGVLVAGAEVGITSYWQAEPRTHERWRYFVHVLDDQQALVAGDDLMPGYGVYGAQMWRADEIVSVRQVVQLPATLAPGRYWIEVGLYDPLSGERAVVDGTAATRTLVGPLKAPLQASAELRDATHLLADFGDELVLDGYTLAQEDATLRVTLRLAALRAPEHDYTVFLHVEDAAGELVAQADAQPRDGQYPTAIWDAGEVVVATWQVNLPPTLEAGTYRVWMGVYEWQSGARLPVAADGATVNVDRLLLREITVP